MAAPKSLYTKEQIALKLATSHNPITLEIKSFLNNDFATTI